MRWKRFACWSTAVCSYSPVTATRSKATSAHLEIPETLHALIASRLDSLPPRQRALLQDAGVVGSTFSIESLRVVNGASHEELVTELRDLVRKEFVFADNDPRSPERGQYGFVQGVIREIAVGTLARRDRQAKHARHGALRGIARRRGVGWDCGRPVSRGLPSYP